MYRKLFVILLLSLFSVTLGCATKEIDPDANQKFAADPDAAARGMQQSMEKSGMKMRPEAMEQMKKMQDSQKAGAAKAASGTPAP